MMNNVINEAVETNQPVQEVHTIASPKASEVNSQLDLEKITNQMIKHFENQEKRFIIKLNPERLGEMEIEVNFEEANRYITIKCNEPETLKMISNQVSDLVQILQEKTNLETVVYIEEQKQDFLQQEENKGHQREEKREDKKETTKDNGDFLQQLRLGLI